MAWRSDGTTPIPVWVGVEGAEPIFQRFRHPFLGALSAHPLPLDHGWERAEFPSPMLLSTAAPWLSLVGAGPQGSPWVSGCFHLNLPQGLSASSEPTLSTAALVQVLSRQQVWVTVLSCVVMGGQRGSRGPKEISGYLQASHGVISQACMIGSGLMGVHLVATLFHYHICLLFFFFAGMATLLHSKPTFVGIWKHLVPSRCKWAGNDKQI